MRKFPVRRAIAIWQDLYPDPWELECVLRAELEMCHGTFKVGGQQVTREYPRTERNLTLMLLALEDS